MKKLENAKAKKYKINFETVNGNKFEIIPPDKIAASNKRIKEKMKNVNREFIKKQFLSQRTAEKLIINT